MGKQSLVSARRALSSLLVGCAAFGALASPALAANDWDFSSDPGFGVVQQVAAGVSCAGGWDSAAQALSLSLAGSGDGNVQACALVGGELPLTTAADPFVFSFDYLLPVAPSGELTTSGPSVTLASSAAWDPLGNYLGSALRFDVFNLGTAFGLYLSTSDADLDPLPLFVDSGVALQPGVTYRIQVRYLPDTSTLEFEATDVDSGVVVRSGTIADFTLLAEFDRYFVSATAFGADIDTRTLIDNVSFQGASAGEQAVSVDVLPGRRQSCLVDDAHGMLTVAVLGSADFSVADVDQSSLVLDPFVPRDADRGPRCRTRDLDRDGNDDLLCRFRGDAPGADGEMLTLTLSGTLQGGTPFSGSDTVCTSAERRHHHGRHGGHDRDHGKDHHEGGHGKDQDRDRGDRHH